MMGESPKCPRTSCGGSLFVDREERCWKCGFCARSFVEFLGGFVQLKPREPERGTK